MIQYYMPTEIFWGEGCLKKAGERIARLGSKAFIVTGKRSARISGALPDLEEVLHRTGIDYYHFDSIEENPELLVVQEGAGLMKVNRCDFVIGIGGGSSIDAAKAISVIAANDLEGRECYQPEKIKRAYPIMAIPTTAGTGTEVTPYSVISDRHLKKKAGFGNHLMFPALSFCDPGYTRSLPKKVTIDTALDALSHLLEGIYSRKRCDLLFPLIFAGIKSILNNLEPAVKNPDNIHYREKLLTASFYGGMVIAQSSTTLQHSIGYPLTTHYGLSHGKANGVVMRSIMELFSPSIEKELHLLFQHLGIERREFYGWLDNWLTDPQLSLSEEFIESATEDILGSRNMAQNPLEISGEDIKKILRQL